MKKLISFIICVLLSVSLIPGNAFAYDDNGKIDLYEVFSNRQDMMKTEVGSQVYKWSMYLPDDGVIYKSERANYFSMSTTSYQSTIQLEVAKNEDALTLEDMLYKMQNSSRMDNYWMWGDKEFYVDIAQDGSGQRYIKIIKTNTFYDYYMVDSAAQEFSDYIENRIYTANDYIYNLTLMMTGDFYRQHEDMFDKLINSFKVSYDANNPYIKELSESVSKTREYKNTSYGWKITLSPYWRVEGTPNARNQIFRPVYTDAELNFQNSESEDTDELQISEGITVSLVSSSNEGETAEKWAGMEIDMLKENFNSTVYEVIKNEPVKNKNAQRVTVRYKTVTKNPYIVDSIYILGNNYKYLISATMKEEKYKDDSKRKNLDNMLNSFSLDSKSLSKYLGRIVSAESLLNFNAPKELKTKKYDFATRVTKGWDTSSGSNGYYNDYYMDYGMYEKIGTVNTISNEEAVFSFEPVSGIRINMSAGLNGNEIDMTVSDYIQKYQGDSDVVIGLASVKIQSAEIRGAQVYKIKKEYDISAINSFVESDATKAYNLESLQNEYVYFIKIGKDTYIENITIPVANTTNKNMQKVNELWSNTTINKVHFDNPNKWIEHSLDELSSSN